jgi:hypothetical protein
MCLATARLFTLLSARIATVLSLAARHVGNRLVYTLSGRVTEAVDSLDAALNNVARRICNSSNRVARKTESLAYRGIYARYKSYHFFL